MDRFLRRTALVLGTLALVAWTGLYLSTPVPRPQPFTISAGESAASVIAGLKDEGYIRSTLFFRLALQESGQATKLQPGMYDLSAVATYDDIIAVLASGSPSAEEVVLRVIEGWTIREIAAEVERLGLATQAEFIAETGRPAVDLRTIPGDAPPDRSGEFAFLADKPSYVSLEGYLFPDTYRVFRDATAADVVDLLLANFDRRVDADLRSRIEASGRTLFEAVTLASIVEREVRTDDDRRKVADLFWRRFDVGMGLQADSTVNYVTGKGTPAITYDDTRLDSRYNTYKHAGLPLGPIGNPGLSALRAVADPEPNPYWYFLTDAEGTVHYGRTLDEHNRNKAQYLK